MSHSKDASRLQLLFVAAGFATFIDCSQAVAADRDLQNLASPEALRTQVAELTALVNSLSQRDQRQIEALSTEVKSLHAQIDQTAIAKLSPRTESAPQDSNGQRSAQQVQHTDDAQTALPRVVQNSAHRFALQSNDGQYSIGITGDIQIDTGAYLGFHAASPFSGPQALSNGVNARRARIGVTGTAAGNWGFALVYDAGNSSDQTPKGIETAQIIYSGRPGAAFELGYSNTYFTLDQSTSSNDTIFIERASPSNVATSLNTGDARTNAGFRFFGNRYWAGAYLTGPASGDSHALTSERFGAFQRMAFQVLKGDDYSLHLGVGVDELLQAPNSGNGTAAALTLSDQPELRIDPTAILNTGTIGTLSNPVKHAYVVDLESAATYRSLLWQGEYYNYQVDRAGLPISRFDGGYGQISWTLTGEAHAYNPQAASYFRIVPKNPFSPAKGEWGAWEIAARMSYVNLNSNFRSGIALSADPAAIDGGQQIGYSLGLNWYPNDIVRFLLDYSHIEYQKSNGVLLKTTLLGAPIGVRFNAISLRAQVAY